MLSPSCTFPPLHCSLCSMDPGSRHALAGSHPLGQGGSWRTGQWEWKWQVNYSCARLPQDTPGSPHYDPPLIRRAFMKLLFSCTGAKPMFKNQIPCLSDVFDYFVDPLCDDCQLGSGSRASVGFSAPLLWLHSCVCGLKLCNTFPNASCTLAV